MPYLSTPPATCRASKMVTLTPLLRQVSGAGQAGRSGADDGRPLCPGRRRAAGLLVPAASHGEIGHEALQPADGHRLKLGAHHAGGFALRFLRADAAADRGQGVGLFQNPVGALDVAVRQGGDEAGDIDLHRAARHAARLLAAQAAVGLEQRAFQVEPERHFLEIVGARSSGGWCGMGARSRRNGLEILRQQRAGRPGQGSGNGAGRRALIPRPAPLLPRADRPASPIRDR